MNTTNVKASESRSIHCCSVAFASCLLSCSAPQPEHTGQGPASTAPSTTQIVEPGIPWPQTHSDLPPDPALHFDRLANGLRIAWQHHAAPAGKCSLRLVVHVGSVDEHDDERGMAHFVEHM